MSNTVPIQAAYAAAAGEGKPQQRFLGLASVSLCVVGAASAMDSVSYLDAPCDGVPRGRAAQRFTSWSVYAGFGLWPVNRFTSQFRSAASRASVSGACAAPGTCAQYRPRAGLALSSVMACSDGDRSRARAIHSVAARTIQNVIVLFIRVSSDWQCQEQETPSPSACLHFSGCGSFAAFTTTAVEQL